MHGYCQYSFLLIHLRTPQGGLASSFHKHGWAVITALGQLVVAMSSHVLATPKRMNRSPGAVVSP
jgi:hypothetical protein